jgi:glycosyltransferase involved in cell wall biosynthesis
MLYMTVSRRSKKVAIFIIAYQAVRTLISCYTRIPKKLRDSAKEIYVFDDCSDDNTYYAGLGYKFKNRINNLNVYRNGLNRGYGGNQKLGYDYARRKGYGIVVLLHGDVQYAPEKIPELIRPLLRNEADLVMGSRMRGHPLQGGMPLWKFLGNKFLTAMENLVLGMGLSEYHSGFRAYSLEALKKVPYRRLTNDFHFDTQILIEFKKRGLRIREIPIPTHYGPESHQVNFLTSLRYGVYILMTLLDYLRRK